MYPQTHFLFSYLVALIFVKFGVFDYRTAFFVALVALLIDVDHFVKFVLRYNDFSLKDAWNRAVLGIYAGRSFIHHWIGFILITIIIVWLFFINKNLFWIFSLGYYSHMFVDYTHFNILKIREKMKIQEAGFVMKINKFEVLFDIFLIVGVVLLVL